MAEQRRSVLSLLQSAESQQVMPSAMANEKYQVVGELGKGGGGRVLKVLDRDLNREVAMKMLLPSAPDARGKQTRDSLIRFIEEAFRDAYSTLRMIQILISIWQAVAYAHSKGIIYRDLKPENVMLGKYGEVLVIDSRP